MSPDGLNALEAARHVPKDGMLLCPEDLASFCANRADIVVSARDVTIDIAFGRLAELAPGHGSVYAPVYAQWLRSGQFGVSYLNGGYVVMQRGYSTNLNGTAFAMAQYGP